jgi:hypothetical protein
VLGYVRVLPDGSASFGIEIWGVGVAEGKPLRLGKGGVGDVEYSFGSLFPDVGQDGWNGVPAQQQQRLKHSVRILVNGATALEVDRDTPNLGHLPVYFGQNPIGGSVVAASFSGRLVRGYRVKPGP